MAVVMLVGTTLTAVAAPQDYRACPVGTCGQVNTPSGIRGGDCNDTYCSKTVYKYICSRCGALYYVCNSANDPHYQ